MNLYSYCGNNPVKGYDPEGTWNWNNVIKAGLVVWKAYVEYSVNRAADLVGTVFSCVELKVNAGLGIGGNLSDNAQAELSRSIYMGLDDGEAITGNEATMELSLFDEFKIGGTYDRLSEKGGRMVSPAANPNESFWGMIEDPNTTIESQTTIGPLVIKESGDILLSTSASSYFGVGGAISAAFNFTELWERLFD